MVPLAVSGKIIIAVVVIGAVLFLVFLLRSEDREKRLDESEKRDREGR